MSQKGFAPLIILIIFSIIFILALIYVFVAKPYKITGSPIAPFQTNELVFGERISYLLNNPKTNDRITFKPTIDSNDYIGIIVKIEGGKFFVASSTGKNPWEITENQITSKIYYPFIKDEEINQTTSQLTISDSTPITPTPTITPTPMIMPSNSLTVTRTPTPVPQKKTIKVSIAGKVYRDIDCNSGLNPSETGIPGVEVNIYQNRSIKLTSFTTDANGDYSFSKYINEDETIVLEAHSVAPPGYKINDLLSYSNVNKSAPDVVINLPRVPYENLGSCPMQ